VSPVIATTLKIKRPSTSAPGMTDAGVASSKKMQIHSRTHTRAFRDAGVFSSAPRGAVRLQPLMAGLATIRSDAPGATAAACGSDSRGVPLQLGFVNGFTNP
jgi:hypothetical protein